MLVRLSSSDSIASVTAARASSISAAVAARADDVVGNLGLDADEVDVRDPSLGLGPAHEGLVGEAEVSQVAEQADHRVVTAAEVAEEAAGAAPESPSGDGHGQRGNKRAQPGLLEPEHRRLDQFLGLCQFGPMPPALGDQIIERHIVGNQPDDRLGRLDRRDDEVRVEHQGANQVGRGHLQLADRELDRPPPVAQLGQGAAIVSFQAGARSGERAGEVRQHLGIAGGLTRDGQAAAGLLEIEIRLGHGQKRIVGRDPLPARLAATTRCAASGS
jgi:hypothetical protein